MRKKRTATRRREPEVLELFKRLLFNDCRLAAAGLLIDAFKKHTAMHELAVAGTLPPDLEPVYLESGTVLMAMLADPDGHSMRLQTWRALDRGELAFKCGTLVDCMAVGLA